MRLQGVKIVVTRSRAQAGELAGALRAEGAIVYEIPSIEIVILPAGIRLLEQELARIQEYSWLLLTSVNTVNVINEALQRTGKDWAIFPKIACIGSATARRVREHDGLVKLVPPLYRAESLAETLIQSGIEGQRILLPRAAGSRPVLPEQLSAAGAIVREIHIYHAQLPPESKQDLIKLFESNRPDFITFTSSSTVRNFAELSGSLTWQQIPVACIGPITAATLREYGVEPVIEATEFTIDGLVNALIGYHHK